MFPGVLVLLAFIVLASTNSQELASRMNISEYIIGYSQEPIASQASSLLPNRVLQNCYLGCATCTDTYFDSCTICQSTYNYHNGQCLKECPTGYIATLTTSWDCILLSSLLFDIPFNKIEGYFNILSDSMTLICGNSPYQFYPNYDNNDPYPTKNSGYYFDPTKSYMQMPPNSWSSTNFILNIQHTISFWTWRNPNTNLDQDVVFSKSKDFVSYEWSITLSSTTISYMFNAVGDQGYNSQYELPFSINDPRSAWSSFTFAMAHSSGAYSLSLYQNGVFNSVQSANSPGGKFWWDPEKPFIIGFNSETLVGFDGWIAEISVYSVFITDPQLFLLDCIASSSCFSSCLLGSFLYSNWCASCGSSCSQTCLYTDRCSLCYSASCKYCNGFSSSECLTFTCVYGCTKCSDSLFYTCEACNTNLGLYAHKGVCVNHCPEQYSAQSGSCTGGINWRNIYDFTLDSLAGAPIYYDHWSTTYGLTPSKLYPELNPIPSYDRGFYFTGSNDCYLTTTSDIVFDLDHSHSFWIRTADSNSQTLIHKWNSDSSAEFSLILYIVGFWPWISIRLNTPDSSSSSAETTYDVLENNYPIEKDVWIIFTLIIRFIRGSTFYNLCIYDSCKGLTRITNGFFSDMSSKAIYGASLQGGVYSNPFHGFMYRILYYSYDVSSTDLAILFLKTCTGCDYCTGTGKCLGTCDWNFYLDTGSGSCKSCLSSCQYGCINGDNCSLCKANACQQCSSFYTSSCDTCYTATYWDGVKNCVCLNGHDFDYEKLECKNPCFSLCTSCNGLQMSQCTACKSEYKLYNGFCVLNCPLGYINNQSVCELQSSALYISYKFNQILNPQYDSISAYPISLGSDSRYYPDYGSDNPWTLPNRGLWFRENSLASIKPPEADPSDRITLGLSQNIDLWTMISPQDINGAILAVYTTDSYLLLIQCYQTSSGYSFEACYNVTNEYDSSTVKYCLQSSSYTYNNWQRVVLSYSYSAYISKASLFVNVDKVDSWTHGDAIYKENYEYKFGLGTWNSQLSFSGCIYSLKIRNFGAESIPIWSSTCGYPFCTGDGEGLINCMSNEYYDSADKSCKACDQSCSIGCARGNSCSLHENPLCYSFSSYEFAKCIECKINAINTPPCTCSDTFEYDPVSESCACPKDYQLLNGNCIACFRYLQPTEIKAYFTSTFVRIIFELGIPIDTTNLDCEKIFPTNVLSKFGNRYLCYFNLEATKIIIDLGDEFTIENEPIEIIKGALKGKNAECGHFLYDLNIDLDYSVPSLYPSAKIDAPNTVLYNCEDLSISGHKSTGHIKSSLYYKWNITSEPSIPALLNYNTDFLKEATGFTIPKTDLSTAKITISLTVKNRFGNEDTTSLVVEAVSDEISMNFDRAIDYQTLYTDYAEYAIGSISSCSLLQGANFTWKLLSAVGNYSKIDENSLWGSQTAQATLNLPQRSLSPRLNATFSIEAFDSSSNLQGRSTLDITIKAANPYIEFSRASGSADTRHPIFINASLSYDPNERKPLEFEWACSFENSTDCSSVISDPTLPNLTLPADSLAQGQIYEFTLTCLLELGSRRQLSSVFSQNLFDKGYNRHLSNEFVQSQKIITLSTLSYEIPAVSITNPLTGSQPDIFSLNSPLRFEASITSDSKKSYSYTWSIPGSENVEFLTPQGQLFLSISPDSLSPGQSYTLLLSVSDGKLNSYFEYKFYSNSPPYSGTFNVTPTSGIELKTFFKMEALEWVDDESNYPLYYSYGYVAENSDIYLNFKNQSSTHYSTFPYLGNELEVFIVIYDSLGAYTRKTSSISISQNLIFNQTELFISYKDFANAETSNPQVFPWIISTLCNSILNRDYYLKGKYREPSPSDLQLWQNVVQFTIESIDFLIEISQFDSQSISVFSCLLGVVSANPYLHISSLENKVFLIIDEIFNSISSSQALYEQQINDYFKVIDQVYQYNSTTLVVKNRELAAAVQSTNKIQSATLSQMVLNENKESKMTNIGVTMAVMKANDLNGYQLNSTGRNASVLFPDDFTAMLADATNETIVDIAMMVLDCPNDPNSISSSVVDISIYGHKSREKISVNSTSSRILIQIPVWNAKYSNYTPQCVFLDTKSMNWSTEGCIKYKSDSQSVTCSCSHLTTFTVLNAASSSIVNSNIGDTFNANAWLSLNATNAAGLYFCIATLIIYGILGVLAINRDRKIEKEEENRRIKLKGTPKKINKVATKFGNSSGKIGDESPKKPSKKSCWPWKKSDREYKEQKSASFVTPKEVFVYSFSEDSLNRSTEDTDENARFKKLIWYFAKKHELFSIYLVRDPYLTSLSRITLFFLALLGQMFFMGMFYQNSDSSSENVYYNSSSPTNSTISNNDDNSSVNYSWTDFWIMVWSSLFMIIITTLLNFLLKEKLVEDQMTEMQYKRIKRQNKIKRIVGLILAWGFMIYFCWSIVLFAIQFNESVSRTWVLNVGVGYIVNICFTSVVKAALYAYIAIKVVEFYEKYKRKKFRQNNELESDDLIDEIQTATPGLKGNGKIADIDTSIPKEEEEKTKDRAKRVVAAHKV
ncbi:unnamed protein product [Blepharisma stoltei]|uniref:GAIN-B domain-containing protein n=1 Tax=Blepharisma stoltei TaxID=1481888 RepID=A0AAU9IFG2_9CILI|nr:unnamed protein product [Blepharisma stoltei]